MTPRGSTARRKTVRRTPATPQELKPIRDRVKSRGVLGKPKQATRIPITNRMTGETVGYRKPPTLPVEPVRRKRIVTPIRPRLRKR